MDIFNFLKSKKIALSIFMIFLIPNSILSLAVMIADYEELEKYANSPSIMIASTGRSGSSILTVCLHDFVYEKTIVLKSHLIPPINYRGKILFIFSNPDKAAESALHLIINDSLWGYLHFYNMKSSDMNWLKMIGSTTCQTIENNLLSYDALGCAFHLFSWFNCTKCTPQEAQILAIKYENLWDEKTVDAIRNFLNIPNFKLVPKTQRGYKEHELHFKERIFREHYNLGTKSEPRYKAYDEARLLWETSPPLQYFKQN